MPPLDLIPLSSVHHQGQWVEWRFLMSLAQPGALERWVLSIADRVPHLQKPASRNSAGEALFPKANGWLPAVTSDGHVLVKSTEALPGAKKKPVFCKTISCWVVTFPIIFLKFTFPRGALSLIWPAGPLSGPFQGWQLLHTALAYGKRPVFTSTLWVQS